MRWDWITSNSCRHFLTCLVLPSWSWNWNLLWPLWTFEQTLNVEPFSLFLLLGLFTLESYWHYWSLIKRVIRVAECQTIYTEKTLKYALTPIKIQLSRFSHFFTRIYPRNPWHSATLRVIIIVLVNDSRQLSLNPGNWCFFSQCIIIEIIGKSNSTWYHIFIKSAKILPWQ